MKNQTKCILLLISILLCMASLRAQNSTRDVVFLKNGSIVKGSIVELIPSLSVKIQTADGSIFVYAMAEIEKIEKEMIATAQPVISSSALPNQETTETGRTKFSIFGGAAFPVGDFAEESNGSAKTGFTFGMQIVGGGQVGFLIHASYASNSTSLGEYMANSYGASGSSSSWGSILMLTGIKVGTTNPTGTNFFFAPLLGINIGTSPKVDFAYSETNYPYTTTTVNVTMTSATSTALAYGAMMEINAGRVVFGARYIASKPKYQVSVTVSGYSEYGGSGYNINGSGSLALEQSTSIVQLYLGLVL
jgi:hypothetical protein